MSPTVTMEKPAHMSPGQEELAAGVARALCKTGYSPLRDVQVTGRDGVVVLWGHVPTYYLKLLAQEVAQTVRGIRKLENELEVTNNTPGRR